MSLFDDRLDKSFYGKSKPIAVRFVPEALAISGFSREQYLGFDEPKTVIESFAVWLEQHANGRAVFVSDNVAFDWQFINYGPKRNTPCNGKPRHKRQSIILRPLRLPVRCFVNMR